jgi:glycosyltransferase involved in cell wall biosynthesis
MKIAVNAGYGPSLYNFRAPLIASLIDAGVEVVAVAPDDTGDVRRRVEALGARYVAVPLRRAGTGILSDLAYYRALVGILGAEKPDIVLSYTIKPSIYGTLAAFKCGVGRRYAMLTGLGYAFTGGSGLRRKVVHAIAKFLIKTSYKRANGLFLQNPDDETELRALNALPENLPVHIVAGSGVDLAYYREEPLPPRGEGVQVVFLLIARLIRDKGICEFIDALRLLKSKYNVHGVLVAPPDPNPTAIPVAKARAWQREGTIDYVEGTDDVRPYLKACHVYVLPSFYREGTPRTVLEALATGRPVITTDAPGCRETVKLTPEGLKANAQGADVLEGENGFLVWPRSSHAVASAMERFLTDRSLVARMAAKSLELARTKYDVRFVNRAMLDVMLPKNPTLKQLQTRIQLPSS